MAVIHELLTLEIKVFSNPKVYEALEKNLPAVGGTLRGVFASDIGDLSRVLVLREFSDAEALAQARLALLMSTDPLGCGEYLLNVRSESYSLFAFLPAIEPAELGKWYEFRTYRLRQGLLPQTIAAWQEAVPMRHALSPLVGAFAALDGEQPRFMNIWAYASLDERARVRAEAVQKNLWPPRGGPASLTHMNSTIAVAVPFSPLK